MSKYPILKSREVQKFLERMGFVVIRQKGSHKQFKHPDGRVTTLPYHKGRDISPRLLKQIANNISLSIDEFINF